MTQFLKPLFWQLHGIALGLGSTLSLWALAMTLGVALLFALRARTRQRRLRLSVLVRVLFPRRIWKTQAGRTDIFWFAFSALLFAPLFGWMTVASGTITSWLVERSGHFALFAAPQWLAILVATVVMFIANDFAFWLSHVLKHKIPLFWQFHRMHHVPTAMTPFTGFRVHPVDTLLLYYVLAPIAGITGAVLLWLLGPAAAPVAMGGFNLLIFLVTILLIHIQHSHFWVTFGPIWGRIFIAPAHHQLHHSTNPAHFERNYGTSLAIFDRMYGSFAMPEAQRGTIAFGNEASAENPDSIATTAFSPFTDAWRHLRG